MGICIRSTGTQNNVTGAQKLGKHGMKINDVVKRREGVEDKEKAF